MSTKKFSDKDVADLAREDGAEWAVSGACQRDEIASLRAELAALRAAPALTEEELSGLGLAARVLRRRGAVRNAEWLEDLVAKHGEAV